MTVGLAAHHPAEDGDGRNDPGQQKWLLGRSQQGDRLSDHRARCEVDHQVANGYDGRGDAANRG